MNDIMPGHLIVFEGIDGTGKTSQIGLLGDYLRSRGHDILLTFEPTNGIHGRRIRELFADRGQVSHNEELELFIADRRDHVERELKPALAAGKIVLCDRYFLSTVAYQGANGFDPVRVLSLNNFAPVPDLALLLNVSIETSLHRITEGRGQRLNDFEQAESLKKVKAIFDSLDLPYIVRVDAEATLEDTHQAIVTAVESHLFSTPVAPLVQS